MPCQRKEYSMRRGTAASIMVLLAITAASAVSDYLQYDDGSANWLTWGGTYRAVWFNAEDFTPGAQGLLLDFAEFWFYHHSSYPWDTDEFLAEVWMGDQVTGPYAYLSQKFATAVHYSPSYVFYDPPLEITEPDWWQIINTELSSGGWPSHIGDASPPVVPHSYTHVGFSWVPCYTSDFFIRASGSLTTSLENGTWGSIKSMFN
jgi:hypothetical protein